jgi:hypothetical protein
LFITSISNVGGCTALEARVCGTCGTSDQRPLSKGSVGGEGVWQLRICLRKKPLKGGKLLAPEPRFQRQTRLFSKG